MFETALPMIFESRGSLPLPGPDTLLQTCGMPYKTKVRYKSDVILLVINANNK